MTLGLLFTRKREFGVAKFPETIVKLVDSPQESLEELFSQQSSIAQPIADTAPERTSFSAELHPLPPSGEDPRVGELESQYVRLVGKVRDCLETLDTLPIGVPLKVRIAASLTLWD